MKEEQSIIVEEDEPEEHHISMSLMGNMGMI